MEKQRLGSDLLRFSPRHNLLNRKLLNLSLAILYTCRADVSFNGGLKARRDRYHSGT
jgi:hypothetical protein